MAQVLQVIAAVLILVAFAGSQAGRLAPRSYTYLALNLVGSVLLAGLAGLDRQWGFFLLNTVWSLVSLWGLVARARGGAPRAPH